METLSGKTAVITGGASGIGLGIATRLAQQGARVMLADREEEALAAAVTALRQEHGATVQGTVVDVTDPAAVDALAQRTLAAFGAVHVVCNNAGVGLMHRAWEFSLEEWRWVLDVNLFGVIHGIRTFVPLLLEQGEGHVVNTASMAGLTVGEGNAAYCASKQGVVAVSEVLALDLRSCGSSVGASVYCPGFVRTRILDSDRHRAAAGLGDGTALDPALAARQERSRGRLGEGIDPLRAGELVTDAVLADRFWIFNDDAALDRVGARAASIRRLENPAPDRPDDPHAAARAQTGAPPAPTA